MEKKCIQTLRWKTSGISSIHKKKQMNKLSQKILKSHNRQEVSGPKCTSVFAEALHTPITVNLGCWCEAWQQRVWQWCHAGVDPWLKWQEKTTLSSNWTAGLALTGFFKRVNQMFVRWICFVSLLFACCVHVFHTHARSVALIWSS